MIMPHQRRPNFVVVNSNEERVLIKDLGPWDRFPTITNNAEVVVAELAPTLAGRRLHYIDSEGHEDQLLVKDGQFAGFAPIPEDRDGWD